MRAETIGTAFGFAAVGAALLGAMALIEPVRVAGESMHPALHSGDLALVHRDGRPGVGDIALISQPGHGPILHRVVARDGSGRIRTKGDANPVEDIRSADVGHVRGRVIAIVPFGALAERWRR